MNKKYLLKMLKPYYFMIFLSLVFSILSVICTLYIPYLVGNSIDLMIKYVDFNALNRILVLIALFLIISSLLQYVMGLINQKITYSLIKDLRNQTMNKIQKIPLSYLDKQDKGDIVSRIINDIDTLADGLLIGFNQIFTSVVTILVTLVFMFIMNYIMAIVVLILTPLSLFVARFVSTGIHKYFSSQANIKGEQTAFIEEMIRGQKVVKAFAQENKNQEKFEEISFRLEKMALKANFFSSLVNPTTRFVNAIVYSLICFIGAFITLTNPFFTIGNLTTFLSYASQYTKPFNDISSVITELQNSFACLDRVIELLNCEEEKEINSSLENISGNIEIKDVYFAYEKNQKLIEDFSLSVRKGQKIAIVGPTGSGKTTLINLLMRFYDINKGSIEIDNNDIYMYSRNSLRQYVGMVLQETYIKHDTIYNNIVMGKEISNDELIEITKKCHLYNFIMKTNAGFNTIISDNSKLSQGQKQLICIARVMVHLPPILILDEATSSIDTRTELKIQDAFLKMMEGRTTFIVAHRLSTIKEADNIIVLNEGHIVEQGTHLELLAKKGFYFELYNAQFDH